MQLAAVVLHDLIPWCSPRGLALFPADPAVRQAYEEVACARPALVELGREATFRAGTRVTVLNLLRRQTAPQLQDTWLLEGPVPGNGVLIPRLPELYALVTGPCWDGDFVWALIAGRSLAPLHTVMSRPEARPCWMGESAWAVA